jgi:hypothetical protein
MSRQADGYSNEAKNVYTIKRETDRREMENVQQRVKKNHTFVFKK